MSSPFMSSPFVQHFVFAFFGCTIGLAAVGWTLSRRWDITLLLGSSPSAAWIGSILLAFATDICRGLLVPTKCQLKILEDLINLVEMGMPLLFLYLAALLTGAFALTSLWLVGRGLWSIGRRSYAAIARRMPWPSLKRRPENLNAGGPP